MMNPWIVPSLSCTSLLLFISCNDAIQYGVDVSFPMHHKTLHPMYHNDNTTKQSFYDEYVKSCKQYATHEASLTPEHCDTTENGRMKLMLEQPKSMYNFTSKGYTKITTPSTIYSKLLQFFHSNYPHNRVLEDWDGGSISYVNHWSSPTYMLHIENSTLSNGGRQFQQTLWNELRPVLQDWIGDTQELQLKPCSLYGIRIYEQGSILAPHVDRLPLVTSAIINVDQDVDEPWPLEVIGRDGIAVNITMEPGDMVLYESHSLIHGRPFPLQGRYMANIFIHFEPVSREPVPATQLPIYIVPDSVGAEKWKKDYPNGYPLFQPNEIDAHEAAKDGDNEYLLEIFEMNSHAVLNSTDRNGWQPLHQAIRYGHYETVQLLIELGANTNQRTYKNYVPNVGGSPLYWAQEFWGKDGAITALLKEHGAQYAKPGGDFLVVETVADDEL